VAAERHPTALLPKPLARTLGYGLLALLGATEWRRMIDGAGLLGAIGWVGAGVLIAECVRAASDMPARWRGAAAGLATVVGFVLAALVSGLEPRLLAPAHWSELADGIGRGLEALSSVTLPYLGADPWPEATVRLGGTLLVAASAVLVAWPRQEGRGFPFLALALLLVLVITPLTALGSTRSLMLGAAIAALTVCFLWLERLPLRPGAGVAVLGGLALAGALPLSAAANRDGPWFDYRSWAEGLGTPAPVRFDWEHSYEPITWPREGREMLRIKSDQPHYWKLENLEYFDGTRWETRATPDSVGDAPVADLDPDWQAHHEWSGTARITVRGLRGTDLVGAGTTLEVDAGRNETMSTLSPGTWRAVRDFAPGDSYEIRFHAPGPKPRQLETATSGATGEQSDSLELVVPLTEAVLQKQRDYYSRAVTWTKLVVPPFNVRRPPEAFYERSGSTGSGVAALRNSPYWRTWQLAQRLRKGATTPYEYARRIDAYLGANGFHYDERPTAPTRATQAPLDVFLFDSKAGYCQHFSGAMALLLRLGGVPARVATGFSPGGFKRSQGEWVVRDRDAHSWVEAWYDGIGWVNFDPTPSATPARSLIAAIDDTPALSAEDVNTAVGGNAAGLDPAKGVREPDPSGPAAAATGGQQDGSSPWVIVLGVAALVALLAGIALHRRRARRFPAVAPAERALAELVRALQRAGRPVSPGTTLAQLERRLGRTGGGAAYFAALREARYRASGAPPSPGQRRALRRELAAGLGWRGRFQAWWALPPRLGRPGRIPQ
jgi:transglutaminase-like putative cysteine protease